MMVIDLRLRRLAPLLLGAALALVPVAARSGSKEQEEARLHFKVAQLALERGDARTAVAEARLAAELDPSNGVFRYYLAVAQKQQNPRAALENVRRARKLGLKGTDKEAALNLEAELTYEIRRRSAAPAGEAAADRNPKDGLQYVRLPPGEFQMGCLPQDSRCGDDEKPGHPARIAQGFWIGRTEVTVAAFRAFVDATGYQTAAEKEGWAFAWNGTRWDRQDGLNWKSPGFRQGPNHPVVALSWDEAAAFCAWSGGRLPTESEWEYAARGGRAEGIFPWPGPPTHDLANYGRDKGGGPLSEGRDRWDYTAPAASFPPNGFGLYDMAGNVWEWTADWFSSYRDALTPGPAGAPPQPSRVLRGGSWNFGAWVLRPSYRYALDPAVRSVNLGVRCARDTSP